MQRNGFLLFDRSIEVIQPREAEIIDRILKSIDRTNASSFAVRRHAIRQQHAKSHGILKGELTVRDDLPDELRQGMFSKPRSYPVILRFSTALGDIRSDRIQVPRGMALKVLGVEGAKMLLGDDSSNQDFLLVNHKTYFSDVTAYLALQRTLELQPSLPDVVLRGFGLGARSVKTALGLLGVRPPMAVDPVADPGHNILGETFHSQAPIRFGDYVARVSAVPVSDSLLPLAGAPIASDDNALRDVVAEFFRRNTAEYEIRAQLCVDLARMPVEDASIAWPEDLSPSRPVGLLSLPPQETFSRERQSYGEDVLSFDPWRCLVAHQPLGSIMRVRKDAYRASSVFRHEKNHQLMQEPSDISELPD